MRDVSELVDAYVAVWNEPDAAVRRRRIEAVWTPDGTSRHRLIDAGGYDTIEARVTGSWDKWVSGGRHAFRRRHAVAHHDVVKLEFVMVALPSGAVVANGLSFLILDHDGRIRHDLQFNPSADDASALVERYVALVNEPDGTARRRQLAALWTEDGSLIDEAAVRRGHDNLAAALGARGVAFASAGATQAHHNLIKFRWRAGAIAGTELLMLDPAGRIRLDYRFTEAA